MVVRHGSRPPVPAAFAVAAGFVALLALDWGLVIGDARSGLVAPTAAAAAVVAVVAFVAPSAALPIAAIAWTTPAGFAAPPYPDLKVGGTLPAAVALVAVAAGAAFLGRVTRAPRPGVPAGPDALFDAVGHTLRTPLTPIKAAVSALRQPDVVFSAAESDELLETIEECADRLGTQIANLLDLGRISAGTLSPDLRPTAVPELAAAALRPAVELDLPDDIPLVLTDPILLARALRNLLDEAVSHSDPGDRPRVTASCHGNRVVLRIVDHATGLRPALSTEPFDDRHSGAVLGLAVARGLVEACGGRLDEARTPGGGRTTCLDLPCAPAEPERARDAEVAR